MNRMPPQQHMYAYQPPTHTPPLQTAPGCMYPAQEPVFGAPLRFESPATSLLSPYSEEYFAQGAAQQSTNPPLPEPGYFTKPSVVPVQGPVQPPVQPPKNIEGKSVEFGKLSFSQQEPAEVPKVPTFGAGAVAQSTPAGAFKFNSNFKSNDGDFTFSASQTTHSETLLDLLTSDISAKSDATAEFSAAKEQQPNQSGIFTFGSKNVTGFSFDSPQSSGNLFGKTENLFKFGEVNKPVFGIAKSPAREEKTAESDNDSTHVEEDEDGPHFEPIVPLPDKVDVKTGEEEEEEMFCTRAKLYRFDTETKEWKERGIGNVKILKHSTKGKVRLLMRREQVLKICANHYITSDMLLKPNAGSDKSWVWNAIDYAYEEPKNEQLAIRFKTVDEASLFKAKFEEAQKVLLHSPEKPKPQEKKEEISKASESLAVRFGLKEGEWECTVCYVRNKPTDERCVACQTANPNSSSKPEKQETPDAKASPFTFKFGVDSSKPPSSASVASGFSAFGASIPATFAFGTSTTKPVDTVTSGFGSSFIAQFGNKAEPWDCNACSKKNEASADSCVFCKALKDAPKTTVPIATAHAAQPSISTVSDVFGAQFTKKPGQWDCNVCEVRNEASASKCVACQSPSPVAKSAEGAPVSSHAPAVAEFRAQLSKEDGMWDCTVCLVRNKASATSCIACQTPHQASTLETMFAIKDGEWDCDTCLVRNNASADKCVACQTPNPQAKSIVSSAPSTSPFDFTFGSKNPSSQTAQAGFSLPFEASKTFQFGQSSDKTSTPSFKFEAPRTGSVTPSSSTFFASMPIPAGGFKFGLQDPVKETPSADNQTPQSGSASSFLKSIAEKHKEKENVSAPSLGQAEQDQNPLISGKSNAVSFADLAKSSGDFKFGQKDPGFKGFSGAGEQLFSSLPATPSKVDGSNEPEDDGMYKTEEHDDIQFEPVVQMPDKVDLVTGEEDEEVLYSQRVKLFRFDSSVSQWKERGVGILKILKNPANGRLRVLMRREQVLKVCANHWITTTMNLKPLAGSDKAWIWMANDFSDGDAKLEQLAAKFKSPELAEEFKLKFEECQTLLLNIPLQTPHKLVDTGRTAQLIQKAEEMKSGLKDLKFFLTDDKTKIKDDDTQEDVDASVNASSLVIKPQGETTGPTLEWDNYDLRKEALDDTTDSSIYASPLASSPLRKNLFRFGESTGGFSFSFQPGISPSKSPAKLNQSRASVGTDDEQDTTQEDERDGQYFEPVVPLPDLVEISTGEENEQVVFSHRAKLYRYDKEAAQWKERGIGDLKILQNYETKQVRLIMRRDQVLKICANHWITSAMKLEPMKGSEKAWVWSAMDFAEVDKGKIEQLAIRFKLQETANTFKQIFDESKIAQENKELMSPVAARVTTQEGGSMSAPTATAVCGKEAIAVLEDATKECTELPPDNKPCAAVSPGPSSKTVVSPPKFVFGTDSLQRFFGSPKPQAESELSTSVAETKDSEPPSVAPVFKIPDKGKASSLLGPNFFLLFFLINITTGFGHEILLNCLVYNLHFITPTSF